MSDVDSAAPHVADDLVRFLADYPAEHGAPMAELPEHLRDADLLTVAEDDALIEFCRRRHVYVGGISNPTLVVEKGWEAPRWISRDRAPMDHFLAGDANRDERIRLISA